MTDERFAQITAAMKLMPITWAMRYCAIESCKCRGCAGISGKLVGNGISRAEWKEWWRRQVDTLVIDGNDMPATQPNQNIK